MKIFWNEWSKTISKKGVWYIGGKNKKKTKQKQKQRGKGIPLGLIVSVAEPILSEVPKPIF